MEAVSMPAIQPLMLDRAHTRPSHPPRSAACAPLHLEAFEIGSSTLKLSKLDK